MTSAADGEAREDREDAPDEGEFRREVTAFRDWIGETYPAEAGRYHLYVARPCPWAHGTAVVRALLGLEDAVSMDVVDPYREQAGWQFSPERDDCTPDTVNGYSYLREVYAAADPGYSGRVSVPVLWDRESETIVNNESIEIMKMLAAEFRSVGDRDVDLYPEGLRDEIDRIVTELYEPINNGVYRAGFARSQSAYDRAVNALFEALDRWDAVLADQRYLAGDRLTLADIRLFPTLLRFDAVYHTHFKCNRARIVDYPNLWGHTRELYQLPGVADTVNLAHIKEHYYTTHTDINPRSIIAVGPDLDFKADHGRDQLPGGPPEVLA